ncbi:FMRFamide receptor [Elysia marginata]|uniref:FMRFamide receptor n=1 Tax=Elysia marginata TaxID=1093978 RepID=A0AAV4FJD9_9GAST|nr:FMRFamide receptor [Elysia marginata]
MTKISPNEQLYVVMVGFIGGVISLLGLVANCLSLPVLLRKEMRVSNSTLCLIMLGVYDLVLLLIDFMTTSLDWSIFGLDPDALFLYKFTMPASVVCDPITMVLITASVYTTVILSLDRCMAVLRPLHWTGTFTRRRIKIALVVVFISALIVDAPVYFQAKLHMVYYPKFNDTLVGGKPTEYYFSWFHQEIYMKQIMPICQIIIPLILIVSSNTAIVAKLVIQKRKSNELQGRGRMFTGIQTPQRLSVSAAVSSLDSTTASTFCGDDNNILNPLSLQNTFHSGKGNISHLDMPHCRRKDMHIENKLTSSGENLSNMETITSKNLVPKTPKYITDFEHSDKLNNGSNTKTTTTDPENNTPANKPVRAKAAKTHSKSHGVDISKLTAQVVAISLITLTSRTLAAANFYIVTEEDVFYVKYCSRACGWTGALNILFVKINSSVNFLFYCFFGGKFRSVFKKTFGCFWHPRNREKSGHARNYPKANMVLRNGNLQ